MSQVLGRAAINKRQQLWFEEFMPGVQASLAVFMEQPLVTVVRVSKISSHDKGVHYVPFDVTNRVFSLS